MLDAIYTFITSYPASLPIFLLLVCTAVLGGVVTYDHIKGNQ
jgi:hypothetical protein